LQHLSMFLAPSLVIAFFMKGDFYSYLDLKNKPCLVAAVLSVLFIVFLLPLNSYLAWLNAGIDLPGWLDGFERWIDKKEMQAERITGILMSAGNVGGLLINLLVIAVIPAVGEEFLYRGVLQNIFARWLRSGIFAVILTALIFSATHLQFYGFVPRFILGLGFGYIYLWSRNIWLPVLAHLTNNAIPVVLSYFMTWENINSTMDEFSSSDGILAIIPAVIAVLIIIIIRKLSLKGD
ncbi:MAG: CPBP family intramembrane metalloprotease, partial [Bacteroidales bacterium]|nr:CPBP family intramembrane metalloprotease [Bacteroidales bacterium]